MDAPPLDSLVFSSSVAATLILLDVLVFLLRPSEILGWERKADSASTCSRRSLSSI